MRKAIDKDLEEGLFSGPFPETEIMEKYPEVLLNYLGSEIKDLARPGVRPLVDATLGGPADTFISQCSPLGPVFRMPCA